MSHNMEAVEATRTRFNKKTRRIESAGFGEFAVIRLTSM
jgi:hypothetical protein